MLRGIALKKIKRSLKEIVLIIKGKIMYYTFINDIFYESEVIINEPNNLPIELSFIQGKVVDLDNCPSFVFTTNAKTGDRIRDFLKASIPVVSNKFLKLLNKAGVDNLQVVPIIIRSEIDGNEWLTHSAINVLGMISCADLDRSDFAEIMPGYYKFRKLAINADKTKGALMFRLHEHAPTILVNKSVITYILDNDPDDELTGWEFDDIIQ